MVNMASLVNGKKDTNGKNDKTYKTYTMDKQPK